MNIDFSNPTTILLLVAAIVAIVIVIAMVEYRRRTKARLRERFGGEYDRAVLTHGSESKAEAVLTDREKRVRGLKLRELAPSQRERFITDWNLTQARFVDHPKGALAEADELVTSLMQARGYPVSGYEDCAEDISVHYPRLIESYRSGHTIAVLSAQGKASTEELRTAMLQYRNLFDELVGSPAVADQTAWHPKVVPARNTR